MTARRVGRRGRLSLGAAAAALPALAGERGTALAHAGQAPAPHDLPAAWNWDPPLLLLFALAAGAYGLGFARLRRRAGKRPQAVTRRAAAFAVGLGVLVAAVAGPLHALGSALFAAHMVQHLLLILVAAPLLLLGRPEVPWLAAAPAGPRRWLSRRARPAAARALGPAAEPAAAWSLHAAAVWAWHLPLLYDAALRHEAVHALEHGTLLGTALLFWWPLVGFRRRLDGGAAFLYLLAASLQGMALGALMALSHSPWYAAHASTTAAWGLTPLQDQRLAGLAMGVPGGMLYGLAAAALLVVWLQRPEDEPAAPPPAARPARGEHHRGGAWPAKRP